MINNQITSNFSNINFLNLIVKNQDLKTDISEKFMAIFPSWPMMLATIISLILVIIFLSFLVYKPIKNAMKKRHDFIQKNIDEAKENQRLSLEKLDLANEHLEQAHRSADDLIKDAKLKAEKVMNTYTEKAKLNAKQIMDEAELDINNRRIVMEEEAKANVVETALELTKKILQKEVTKKNEAEIIEKFLAEK
ncbi:F0F1 ATP synthase subunit B [Mycoplasmopsis hyopharyngis]|uniref:F0F1 ATP synthase subunit B n=1 Tax=Mycoplasmopsis hyopharyngis TaxID=29558 RepID=UPI003873707A